MSFHNLTPAWTDQPLDTPSAAADVVDLMVSLGDRRRGTFTVLLCDPDDHYRATLTIDLPSEFDHLTPGPEPGAARSSPQRTATAFPSTADISAACSSPLRTAAAFRSPGRSGGACSSALAPIVPAVQTAPGTGLILALGRPGPPRLPAVDQDWSTAAATICASAGIRLMSFHVATSHGVYQPALPESTAAA